MQHINIFTKTRWLVTIILLTSLCISNAWGASIAYTFSNKDWNASPANWTKNTSGSGFESANDARGVANNNVNGKCTSPITFSNVTTISVVASSNKADGKVKISLGGTDIANKTIAKTNNATYTYNSSDYANIEKLSGNVVIQVTYPSGSKTVWVKSITITYKATVTFNANGGSCGTPSLTQSTPTSTITLPTPTRDGYTCTGWYTASSSGTKRGNAGATYTPSASETLYAQWEAAASCDNQVTITNSATTNVTNGSFDVDKTGAQDACSALSVVVTPHPNTHYHVTSVSATNPATSGTAGTAVDNGNGTYTITYSANAKGNSTISVTFAEDTKHSVAWKVNNASYSTGNPSSQVYDGETIATFPTAPSSCDPTKEFVGWTATAIGQTPTNTKPTFVSPQTAVTGNLELHAVFATKTANSYSLGDVNDLISGQTVIIYNDNKSRALASTTYAANKQLNGVSATFSSGKITSPASAIIWTVQNDGKKLQFKSGNNYLRNTSAANDKLVCDGTSFSWTVDKVSSGVYTLTGLTASNTSYLLEAWSSNSNYYFTTYSGSGANYNMKFYVPTYTAYITRCCDAPTDLGKGSFNRSTQVMPITWTSGAGKVDVCYSTSSTAPAASPSASYTVISNQTSSPVNISASSLAAGNYYCWVRSVCSADSKSDWTAITGNYFTIPAHQVTISKTGGDNSCSLNKNTQNIVEGRTLQVTATAGPGSTFTSWAVSGTNASINSTTANPVTFTMGTADATLTATFTCITPSFSSDLSTTQVDYTQGEDAAPLSVTAAAGTATLSYQWQKSANGTSGWENVGINSSSYIPSTENTGDLYYHCIVTNAATSCSTSNTSKVAHIHVDEPSCTAPTAVVASSPTNTGATLTVTDDNNVNKYDFYCSTSSTKPANNATPTASVSDGNAKAITGLAYGTTYYYWARTNCGESKSPWYPDENPSTFTTTVPAPTSVAAGSLTLTGATLTITDNNSPAIGSYDIYYSTNSTAPEAGTTPSATTTSTSYDLTGLTSGQKYYFWVRGKGPNAKSTWVSGGNFTTLSITAISVQTAPKAAYLVGDNFDPTGLVITRTYSDNVTTDTYTYSGHTSEFTFSPATNAALTAGNNKVTITWNGLTVDQTINVYTVTVNKVEEDGTTAITAGGVTASCNGRTLSRNEGSTNYSFWKWEFDGANNGLAISNNSITGTPTGNVTIKAFFYKPVTVTWQSNRQPVDAGAQTTSVKRGTQWKDLTLPEDPSAPTSCSTKTFKGWTDMSEDWSGDSHDAAPTVCLKSFSGVTTAINDPITFKAVFATDNAGTKSLTNSEIESFYCNDNNCNPKTTEYANGPFTIPSDDGNWSGICAAGSVGTPAVKSLNIKNNKVTISNTQYRTYLLSPTCAENITKISVVATHQANSNRNLYICSEVNDNLASNNIGHIEVVNGNTSAQDITPSSNVKSFYICTSDAVQIRSVTIYYGSTGDFVTECCEALDDINGGVTWSDAATAVLTWDDLENVDGTTPYNVTYRTGSAAFDNTNVGSISTNDQGKWTCSITGLTPCANYDFMITANPADGYCEKDQTINDSQTHAWGVSFPTLTGTTQKSGDATSCATSNYVATFEAASEAYELPDESGVTVTIGGSAATITTDYTWAVSGGVGTLTVLQASITGDIAISIASVAHTCNDDPDLDDASLSGTLNLTIVGVSCEGIDPGSYCAVESGDYGFIWYAGTGDKVIGDDGVTKVAISTGDYSSGAFAAELSGTFNLGDTYTFRAFAENTGDKVGYSDAVSFKLRSVTFNKNNGEENVVVYVNNGSAVAQPSAPSKVGYDFNYWQKTSGAYDFSTLVEGNITLTAIWGSKSYDVTLKANGGSGDDQVVSAMYDDDMPTEGVTVHSKTGYTLLGYWDATSDGKQYYSYDAGTSTLSSESSWDKTAATNLFARWQANEYTVTFDKQGGKNGYNNRTATFDAAMPALTRPSRDGYAFSGYFDAINGGGKKYYNADGSSAATWDKAENTTLYAYWIPVMTFSVNGVVDGTLTRNDNTAMPSSAAVPAACGSCWEFIGWSTNANESGAPAYAGGATHQFGEPTRLYAVFGKTEYQLITSEEDLVANDNYVVASSTEWALSNAEHSYYSQDAASADISSISKSTASGYYIYNPSASIIWKFTGNKDAGQLYNVAAEKYINLTESKILGASQDLKFTLMADGEAWVIQYSTTNYLHGYSSNYGNGFESMTPTYWTEDSYSAYLYRQKNAEYATQPGCAAYTIAWKKDGATYSEGDPTTSATQCEGIESIPDAPEDDALSSCSEKFVGWSENELYGTGNAAPADLFADLAGTPVVDGDKTFHAVFATTDPDNKQDASITTTFTSKSWEDDNSLWEASSDGYAKEAKGVQVTKDLAGLYVTTKDSYYEVKSVVITYGTASSASGSITVAVGGTSMEITDGSISGGQSDQTLTFEPSSPATSLTGTVKFTVSPTNKSIYVKSVQINYTNVGYKDYITSCCTPHTITLSGVDEEEGKVFSADKEQTCEDKLVTLSYTEDGFYTFDSWTVTKASSGTVTVTDNTFTMPDEAVTVTASWNAKPYSLTVVQPTNGNVTITGSDNSYGARDVDYKTAINLVAEPADDDHVFQSWTITPNNIGLDPTEPTLNFTMPGEAISFTANFGDVANSVLTLGESEIYTLTAVDNTTGQAIDLSSVKAGKSIKVSYTIDGQYEATGWTTTPTVVTNAVDNYVTFKMPAEDLTVDLNIQPYYLLNLSAVHGSISSVSINGVDQGEEIQSQYRVHKNDVVTLTASAADETYKFVEWSGATVTNGQLTIGTSNVNLSAVFTSKDRFNLTLVTCGRTQQVINALEGESILSIIDGKTAPALTGYTFVGWSETEDGEAISTNDLKLTADKSVYAVYSQNAYYEKVTSISEGQYLIVYEEEKIAFNGGLASLDAGRNKISVPLSNHKIAANTTIDAASFTIAEYDGGYSILSTKGKYIGRSAASNGLDVNDGETKNTITFGESGNAIIAGTGGYQLRYNSASGTSNERFRYYSSTSQQDIHLYKKIVPEDNESNPSTVVANGEEFEIDAAMTLNNLTVEAGGKVTGSAALAVNDLTINSEFAKSGQVTGSNINVSGDIYLEIKLLGDGTGTMTTEQSQQWYCISAPFDVSMNDGFFWGNGTQMEHNVDFQAFVYDGAKRANNGTSGWQRVSGKLEAGKAYLIGFNDERTNYKTIRLKAMTKDIPTADKLPTTGHTAAESKNSNWNGVGNPTLHYIALDGFTAKVQCYDNDLHAYKAYDPTTHNYVVGTTLFMQAEDNIDLKAAGNANYRAPKRVSEENENYSFCVEIAKENATRCDNRLYVSTSEEATSSYEQGKDMLSMNGTSSKFGALIWTENYGMRLASEDVPMVNNQATYTMGIYAPANGTYTISTVEASADADLYLTYEGSIIWNLSMGEYEIDLEKGTTNGYGLLLQAKAPQVTTGVDQLDNGDWTLENVQKVIIDEHVFILRGGQMYDVTGKMVK